MTTWLACQENLSDNAGPSNIETESELLSSGENIFYVSEAFVSVHQEPDFNSDTLFFLNYNDTLGFAGQITKDDFVFSNEAYSIKAPWLSINHQNKTGWIYGGFISILEPVDKVLFDRIFNNRFQMIFGDEILEQIHIYLQEKDQIKTLAGFAALQNRAEMIIQKILKRLNGFQQKREYYFYWLNDILDGFLLHFDEKKQLFIFYKDLIFWKKAAQLSPSNTDDLYLDVLLSNFCEDSIEYDQACYLLPYDSSQWISLMGQGIFYDILMRIDRFELENTTYFEAPVEQLLNKLINNIKSNHYYWLDQESVLDEMDRIVHAGFNCIADHDLISIKAKIQLMRNDQLKEVKYDLFNQNSSDL